MQKVRDFGALSPKWDISKYHPHSPRAQGSRQKRRKKEARAEVRDTHRKLISSRQDIAMAVMTSVLL